MLERSCSCGNIIKNKLNLRNHCTRNSIGQYLSVHTFFYHFENEHNFESESIKNEFFDHVMHIKIFQNIRYTLFYIFMAVILKNACHFDSHH